MTKYRCVQCGQIYDPDEGDSSSDIPPGTPFEDVLSSWQCPGCQASRSDFEPIFIDSGDEQEGWRAQYAAGEHPR